jgi:glycosyltransferase involved in cell wall biosynthesis
MDQVERVFAASQAGFDHLRSRHPQHADKLRLARLGTFDHGPGPWSPSRVLRIVSCSRLVPLKRVQMLAAAIKQVTVPVEWTHFGDGPERDRLEVMIAPWSSNVKAVMAGAVPNEELMAWYRTHPVDLFVHLSESEGGVPVVLQEASSFGIPLMACDAGGVGEIVGERTGLLLPRDPTLRQITQLIEEHLTSPRNSAAFRARVRERWMEDFRAEANFNSFADQLLAR